MNSGVLWKWGVSPSSTSTKVPYAFLSPLLSENTGLSNVPKLGLYVAKAVLVSLLRDIT